MIKSVYFKPYELVDRETFRIFGWTSYRFFDPVLLLTADWLREQLGCPVTINDWYWRSDEDAKNVFEWSGFRTQRWDEVEGRKVYSPYSDHALGSALDMKFRDYDANYVRQFIRDNWDRMQDEIDGLQSLTIEEDVSWLHLATRNNNKGLNFFIP